MIYELILTPEAERHLFIWKKSGQKKVLKKIIELFEELKVHPTTGTGQVEQLKGNLAGLWSRRITKGERIIYSIEDEKVIVTVLSLKGHYDNK